MCRTVTCLTVVWCCVTCLVGVWCWVWAFPTAEVVGFTGWVVLWWADGRFVVAVVLGLVVGFIVVFAALVTVVVDVWSL